MTAARRKQRNLAPELERITVPLARRETRGAIPKAAEWSAPVLGSCDGLGGLGCSIIFQKSGPEFRLGGSRGFRVACRSPRGPARTERGPYSTRPAVGAGRDRAVFGEIWHVRLSEADGGFEQVGSIFAARGHEYDWGGVIIGKDLLWRDGRWISDPSVSFDVRARAVSAADFGDQTQRTYQTLLTRSVFGTIVYSVDPETRAYLQSLLPPLPASAGVVRRRRLTGRGTSPRCARSSPRAQRGDQPDKGCRIEEDRT